jgi:hypothetical protein
MKTRTRQGRRRFQLKINSYGNSYYIERITRLEHVLSRKPRTIQIDMIGVGEIPADSALLIRSVLMSRSPRTRVITNARSSLQGGSVLVWLMGDKRIIRDDARLYFRGVEWSEDNEVQPNETSRGKEYAYRDSYSKIDPEEADYFCVLQRINEFLPVKELAGRPFGSPVLKQFGLVDSEAWDKFLAVAFGKSDRALVPG